MFDIIFIYFIISIDLDTQEVYHVALKVKMMIHTRNLQVLCVQLEWMTLLLMVNWWETRSIGQCQRLRNLLTFLNNGKISSIIFNYSVCKMSLSNLKYYKMIYM